MGDGWRKSSFSAEGNCVEVWRKSSASGSDCVEAALGEVVKVRDSKDPDGPVLTFTRREWLAFLNGVHLGEFEP